MLLIQTKILPNNGNNYHLKQTRVHATIMCGTSYWKKKISFNMFDNYVISVVAAALLLVLV